MRVRFGYTVDVSDDQRRVIAAYNDDNHEGLDNVAGRRATPRGSRRLFLRFGLRQWDRRDERLHRRIKILSLDR